MVKKPVKENGTSRIRFIMLEAEMPEGDLTQITNAIQNALRPPNAGSPRGPKASLQVLPVEDHEEDDDSDSVGDDEEAQAEAPARQSVARTRKPAKRKVVEIELDAAPSLADYAASHPPKTEQDRYLVAVAFLSEHRPAVEGVSADHVYTCFRKLGWPTGSKDFAQPLRTLKVRQFVDAGKAKGTYVTNHIGLDKVRKLAGE